MAARTVRAVREAPGNVFSVIPVAGCTAKISSVIAGIGTGMIINAEIPVLGRMALVTVEGSDKVTGIHAGGGIAVMTAGARALDLIMVDGGGR